jgi:hypothetical protein
MPDRKGVYILKKEKNPESLLAPNSAKLSDEQLVSATGGRDDWMPIYVVECLRCQKILGKVDDYDEAWRVLRRHKDEMGQMGPWHNVVIRSELKPE